MRKLKLAILKGLHEHEFNTCKQNKNNFKKFSESKKTYNHKRVKQYK